MAIVMEMLWEGFTTAQYDAVRKAVNLDADIPAGVISHVVSFDEHGLHVSDIWESAEDLQRYVDGRLMPSVHQLGIPGEPRVTVRPVHALLTPARQAARATGTKQKAA